MCHLRNKIDDVNVLIKNHPDKVHIFGINEARLDDNVDDSLIHINNYSFVRTKNWSHWFGGIHSQFNPSFC